jgi:hypothetical protein
VLDEDLEQFLQIEKTRLEPVCERDHVVTEARLEIGALEELVEHLLRVRVLLEFDDDANAVAVGFVADVADALDDLVVAVLVACAMELVAAVVLPAKGKIESIPLSGFTGTTARDVPLAFRIPSTLSGYRNCRRSSAMTRSHWSMPAKVFWKKFVVPTMKTLFTLSGLLYTPSIQFGVSDLVSISGALISNRLIMSVAETRTSWPEVSLVAMIISLMELGSCGLFISCAMVALIRLGLCEAIVSTA